MSPPDVLITSRIRLRRLVSSDGTALHAAATCSHDLDPSVERIDSIEMALDVIAAYARQFELGVRFVYGLFDGEALVGCGAIQPTDIDRRRATPSGGASAEVTIAACNVGLWLVDTARGHGFGAEVTGALATTAFRWLGAERVELWCEPSNEAMVHIAEKLGFAHVARLPRWVRATDGTWRDQTIWRLDRDPAIDLAVSEPVGDPHWLPIRAHLCARYSIVIETERTIAIAVDVAFASGQRFVQHVVVERGAVGCMPWLLIRTPIAREDALTPRTALLHSASLAAGAVTLEAGYYVLRYGVDPLGLHSARLDQIVMLLAHEAVRLRERDVAEDGAVSDAFAAFTD